MPDATTSITAGLTLPTGPIHRDLGASPIPADGFPAFDGRGHERERELALFNEHGFLHVRRVLDPARLATIRAEFDRVWESEKPPHHFYKLLKHRAFIDLIEHPPILDRHRAVFGRQTQLLALDLLRQGPRSDAKARHWHRDFTFPGERCLSINTILYLDDMTPDTGPTYVIPGTHRGEAMPPADKMNEPLPGEVPVYASAGDAVFINSAIWHSGGRNRGDGLRRGIYLYYGYWWLKRYQLEHQLPWQALENATEQRLELLGVKMPQADLHMYDPS